MHRFQDYVLSYAVIVVQHVLTSIARLFSNFFLTVPRGYNLIVNNEFVYADPMPQFNTDLVQFDYLCFFIHLVMQKQLPPYFNILCFIRTIL